jgi:hypothetical protein
MHNPDKEEFRKAYIMRMRDKGKIEAIDLLNFLFSTGRFSINQEYRLSKTNFDQMTDKEIIDELDSINKMP